MSNHTLSVGIVGLPNVGKSTIFNALTKSAVPAENYPFCTIDPNVGVVPVPDGRLDALNGIVHAKRIVPAVVEFVDIAGLVKGAADGEGLGNQFLSHIREVDAIVHIMRAFEDKDITHVEGRIDPADDLQIINTEIGLKDLDIIAKLVHNEERKVKSGDKESQRRIAVLKKVEADLLAAEFELKNITDDEKIFLKDANLLSLKPKIYVMNMSESTLDVPVDFPYEYMKISAKFEAELADISDEDREEFLAMAGIKESGLELLAREAYKTLGLINFFTAGEMEVRAWTIKKGTNAQAAAGVIHTDFSDKFIRMEVVPFESYIKYNGWNEAKENGALRSEGKEYIVQNGDVIVVRHS